MAFVPARIAAQAYHGPRLKGGSVGMRHIVGNKRTVFFVSDQTGVTAETMGHSLLTQFDGHEFNAVTLPFISTVDKAEEAVV